MQTETHNLTFRASKFKELMLYVAEKSVEDVTFDAIKLNKILFFSDFLHFGLAHSSITSATYRREADGPAATQLPAMAKELEQSHCGHFVVELTQRRLVADRPSNSSIFSDEERDLIDDVIKNLEDSDAPDASYLGYISSRAWQISEKGGIIPYTAVFLANHKVTNSGLQSGRVFGFLWKSLLSRRIKSLSSTGAEDITALDNPGLQVLARSAE